MTDKPQSGGEYALEKDKLRGQVTRVRPSRAAVPQEVQERGTPIQPIVIQLPHHPRPDQVEPKEGRRTLDVWSTTAVVLISCVLSGTVSLYVATRFLDEYSSRIERMDYKVEELDKKGREIDMTTTRLQTQVENLRDER